MTARRHRCPARPGALRTLAAALAAAAALALAATATAAPEATLGFSRPLNGTVVDAAGLGTGFTSVQANSAGNEHVPANLRLANGRLTVTSTTGDATANSQQNALQVAVDASEDYRVFARIVGPLGLSDTFEGGGVFVGTGQDSYVKIVASMGAGGPQIQLAKEGSAAVSAAEPTAATAATIDLILEVDVSSGVVTGKYRLGSGTIKTLGGTQTLAAAGGPQARAGIITTHTGAADPIQVSYDHFVVEALGSPGSSQIAFTGRREIVTPASAPGLGSPSQMEIGPDGKLYVANANGKIYVFSINASNNTSLLKVITTIFDRPDGSPSATWQGRQTTGMVFDPASTASQPVLYVSHSDPRIGFEKQPGQSQIPPTSGVITKLTLNASSAVVGNVDIVTGLPRSGENHAPNGMSFGPGGWLYLGQGGNTNAGGQSLSFSYFPEVPLSASIIRVNPAAIGNSTVNVSAGSSFTFTDPCATGESVPNGCTAAWSRPGSPSNPVTGQVAGKVELYATGLRNVYDLTWHSNGQLYANENESNSGLGNTPGAADACPGFTPTNPALPGGAPLNDELFRVVGGAYHGHANPSRGECGRNAGSGFLGGSYVPSIFTYGERSVNGIDEYTAGAFGGKLQGQLLSVSYGTGQNIIRVKLNPAGTAVTESAVLATGFTKPLDVLTRSNGAVLVAEAPFPNPGKVSVIEPIGNFVCPSPGGPPSGAQDLDSDGFTDQDEIDNGTSRCNAGDRPRDFNGNGVSDLNDPDDDSDGIPDAADPLSLDPTNGAATTLPFSQEFLADAGGFFGSGFRGVQLSSRGGGALEGRVGAGGAGGFLQVIATPGTMEGASNDQNNALQQGFVPSGAFVVRGSLAEPFLSGGAHGGEAAGIFIGPGENDFVRLALNANGGSPIIELGVEQGGVFQRSSASPALAVPVSRVELVLQGTRGGTQVTAGYRIGEGALQTIGAVTVPASWLGAPTLAGIATTSAGSGQSQPFAYNDFHIETGAILAAVPGGGAAGPGGGGKAGASKVKLTAQQIRINQRVAQAAVRRLTAIQRWLDAGIRRRDIVPGSLDARVFGKSVTLAGAPTGGVTGAASPRPLKIPAAGRRAKGRIRVTAAQLLINRRIAQAALNRAVGLQRRVKGRLTGGDVKLGAIGSSLLAPGLSVAGTTGTGGRPRASVTRVARVKGPKRVRLRASELLKSQRIAQNAVRRANTLTAKLGSGLVGADFSPGSLTRLNLGRELR